MQVVLIHLMQRAKCTWYDILGGQCGNAPGNLQTH